MQNNFSIFSRRNVLSIFFLLILFLSLGASIILAQRSDEADRYSSYKKHTLINQKPGHIYSTIETRDSLHVIDIDLTEIVDVIVEFKDEPMFIKMKQNSLKKINAAGYRSEQKRFDTDLMTLYEKANRSYSTTFSIPRKKQEYHKIFNGASLSIPKAMISSIASLAYVKKVHLDGKVQADLTECVKIVKADSVWFNYNDQGDSVVVGILDTGIDYTHPALGGGFGKGYKVIGGYDFINNDNDPMDDNGHGTHVAGIVAANADSIKGMAPKALLMAFKVLNSNGSGDFTIMIAAIERAVDPNNDDDYSDKVAVANMSLGGIGSPDDALSTAVDNAVMLGVVFCIAAGNSGSYSAIGSPGTSRLAITVGATDKDDKLAPFTSRGPNKTDYSIKPEITAPGVRVLSTFPNNSFVLMSGTSMATPVVTGLCALLRKKHPGWTPEEIKSAVVSTAKDLSEDAVSQGSGRINVLDAINVSTMLSPSVLSFGPEDAKQNSWTAKKRLTVKNIHSTFQTYNLSFTGEIPGVILSANPSSFIIAPGGLQTVEISLQVNNNIVPYPKSTPLGESFTYSGSLSITGSKDKLHIPWAFAKGVKCVLAFDQPAIFWFLENEDHVYDLFSNYSIDLYKNEFLVSQGSYNLLAFNATPDTSKIVVKSNLPFQTSDSVKVNFSEAVNRIELVGKDKNGHNLFPQSAGTYSLEYRFPRTSDGYPFYFTSFVSPARVHMVSNVSDPIVIYPSGFALPTPNEVHVLEFDSLKGINSSVKLINNYAKMFEQQVTINFPSFTNSPFAYLYGSTVRQVDGTTSYYSMYYLSNCNLINKVGNIRVFLPDPSPSYKLSRPAVSFVLYTDQSFVYPLYYSQPLIAHNNKSGFSVLYNPPAYTYMENPFMSLMLKTGLCFIDGFQLNNYFGPSTIFPNSVVYGSMNELRIDAIYQTQVKIFDEQNNLIKESPLVRLSPISVPKGKYRTEISLPKYGLEGYYGDLKLTSKYDISKDDPNPPVINSVQVRNSKGVPDNWLQKGEGATLLFAMGDGHFVYDPYERLVQYPVVDDSTRAFVKLHGSEIWNRISISKISADQVSGCLYSADLSSFTNYDSAAIDLKLSAFDNSGNSVETVICPIAGIGRFDGVASVNGEENNKTAVKEFALYRNFPNPFNPSTTISYALPKDVLVELSVYDMLGREVKTLIHEQQNAGEHKVTFESGSLSSGIYIYRIKAGQYTCTQKMLLLK